MGRDFNTYIIMAHDRKVCSIERATGIVEIFRKDLVPMDLYLEVGENADNFNNVEVFNWWCAHRILSLDREYAKELLNSCGLKQATTDRDKADIALLCKCLSLKDFYWVQKDTDNFNWKDINLFDNSLSNAVVDIALLGQNLTIHNTELISQDLATDGVFPKAWIREDNGFILLKADRNDSVNKEVYASKLLCKLGFQVLLYEKGQYKGTTIAKCNCFTKKELGYITAGDLNSNYDLDKADDYYRMNLADYLIGNSDRHQDNWGYLFDQNRAIIGFAPLFDFNHAFEAPIDYRCLPEQLFHRNVSALQAASEAAQHLCLKLEPLEGDDDYTKFVNERIQVLYDRELE